MQLEKNIVVIVSGGIAAYKSTLVVRSLMAAGATVRVAMTPAATEFVTEKTFAALTHHPVLTDAYEASQAAEIPHVSWADWADAFVVVPATANLMGQLAQGLAPTAATSLLLARQGPTLVVPAMNVHMWENPAVQRNVRQLTADGMTVLEPATGLLAEGYAGKGRLPEPATIVAAVEALWTPQGLAGKRVLVTAGGTREAIDPVRYIGNRSSGKMGLALAKAAQAAGATVTLVTSVPVPADAAQQVVQIESTLELQTAVTERFAAQDVVIMAAAVADYRVVEPADQKLKKQGEAGLTLNLVQNPDILAGLGQAKTTQYVVGFAAETQDLVAHAQAKLEKKRVDMLVANDVSQAQVGFGHETNAVTILRPAQAPVTLPLQSKQAIAEQIITMISEEL